MEQRLAQIETTLEILRSLMDETRMDVKELKKATRCDINTYRVTKVEEALDAFSKHSVSQQWNMVKLISVIVTVATAVSAAVTILVG